MTVQVKICGLTNAADAVTATEAGAAMLGFVFFDKSPRNLTLEAAKDLGPKLPEGPDRVGVFVDPSDTLIAAAVEALGLDWIQLHGEESPERVADIHKSFPIGIIKAISIESRADFAATALYADHVDVFLFDTKAGDDAPLPGGNGTAFNWALLAEQSIDKPWLLAGGLTPENLHQAVAESGALAVDISSGVETKPGKKDPMLIRAFLNAVSML